jgi:hypothetical protein
MATMTQRRFAQQAATGLGWFSIGLGLAELFFPRAFTHAFGMRGREGLVRFYGLREIGAGVGLLTARNKAPWLWARVAGDGLDIATLAARLPDRRARGNVEVALAMVAGVTALDVYAAKALSEGRTPVLTYGYGSRSGFPASPELMRGRASDFEIPKDFRTPEALRPLRRDLLH